MARCLRCSLVFRNPRPTATDIRDAYATDVESLEAIKRIADRRVHHFRRFLDAMPDPPGRVLDVGCGYGFFLKIAEERGWEAVGVDLDPRGVTYAKERLHVDALLGDPREFRFADRSFDLVTLWDVLDHVPDPRDFLEQIRRVLKESGYVFIRTPNVVWQHLNYRLTCVLLRVGFKRIFEKVPFATFVFHMTSFSSSTLRFLLEHAGFELLNIRNSKPTLGDPYLGLGPTGELLLTLAKLTVHSLAQTAHLVSGGRWVIGPSLDAWAKRK